MTRSIAVLLRCALALVLPPAVVAQPEVFKCVDLQGAISYQDRPCPPNVEQSEPQLDPAPAYTPPPAAVASGKPPSTPILLPALSFPPPAPPTEYRCTSYDDKTYVTSDPAPRGYYVPVLLTTRRGIHLGSGNTDGVLPVLIAPPAAVVATAYTYVQDRCRPMPIGELCGYWDQREDEVRHNLRGAFKDTRPQLEQEQAGLRGQLQTYCGR